MVSLPLLIALLTLIDVTRSFEYFIDPERCKTREMKCYVRDSCIEQQPPGDMNKLEEWVDKTLRNGTCDVIVQMKGFTPKRYHIMMQVNVSASESPSDELDISAGLTIMQQDIQIKCSPNGVDGKIIAETFGSRQIYSKEMIFCSVVSKQSVDFYQVFIGPAYGAVSPTLEISFTNKEKEILKYALPGVIFWIVPYKCNDETIISKNETTDSLLISAIDSAPAVLSCPTPQRIRVKVGDEDIITSSVACNPSNSQWTYKNSEDQDVMVNQAQSLTVQCIVEFSQICSHYPVSYKDCKGCTAPTKSSDGTSVCPSGKWRLSDGSVQNTKARCKRRGNERSSGWFLDDGTEITEGSCSTEYDCFAYNDLDFEQIPTAEGARSFQKAERSDDGNTIECGAGFNLTIISNDKTEEVSTTLTCDPSTGLYKYGAKTIPKSKNAVSIYCSRTKRNETAADKENQPATGAMSGVVIGGSVGGLIAVIAIGGLIAFFVLVS